MKIQEAQFEVQLAEKETRLTQLREEYSQQQEEWAKARSDLEQQYASMASISEQRRLDLLVVQGKLLQAEGENNVEFNDLRKTLATKFPAS